MKYKYQLDRRSGSQYKHECPSCGGKKCFRRYIDIVTKEYLDDTCGKCDHLNSCNFHYPPREFFRDHPMARNDWRDNHPIPDNWSKQPTPPPVISQPDLTPPHYVQEYRSAESNFMRWFLTIAQGIDGGMAIARQLMEDYRIGADKYGRVIFWQIDQQEQVRGGKVMQYTTDGHRNGHPTWMHYVLQNQSGMPKGKDYILDQCFFGEHLLKVYPHRQVAIVESEKTALICSLFYPSRLWLATGGCIGLTVEKMQVLKGRKVLIYPDSGVFEKWKRTMLEAGDMECDITNILEVYPPNTDYADVLLQAD